MHGEGLGQGGTLVHAPRHVQQVMHGWCTALLPKRQGVGVCVSAWHACGMLGHAWGGLGRVGGTWENKGGSPGGLYKGWMGLPVKRMKGPAEDIQVYTEVYRGDRPRYLPPNRSFTGPRACQEHTRVCVYV